MFIPECVWSSLTSWGCFCEALETSVGGALASASSVRFFDLDHPWAIFFGTKNRYSENGILYRIWISVWFSTACKFIVMTSEVWQNTRPQTTRRRRGFILQNNFHFVPNSLRYLNNFFDWPAFHVATTRGLARGSGGTKSGWSRNRKTLINIYITLRSVPSRRRGRNRRGAWRTAKKGAA